jgi:hypothetical protein
VSLAFFPPRVPGGEAALSRVVDGDVYLRYGARIDLTHNGQTRKLMSVHLKMGCFENTSSAIP